MTTVIGNYLEDTEAIISIEKIESYGSHTSIHHVLMFPRVIANIIGDYCAEWKLTQLAFEHRAEIGFEYMCGNPRACDYIRECLNDETLHVKVEPYWAELSSNYGAADLLRAYPDKVCFTYLGFVKDASPYAVELFRNRINEFSQTEWSFLSGNPTYIDIIESNLDKVDWSFLSKNHAAHHILEKNPEKIDWHVISGCSWAINLLEANQDKLVWETLSCNRAAIHLLRKDPARVHWSNASKHGLIELLREFPDLINWFELSRCKVPSIIPFIKNNLDKVFWTEISENSIMIDVLRENPDKINWVYLSGNQAAWDMMMTRPAELYWEDAGTQPEIFEAVHPAGLINILST